MKKLLVVFGSLVLSFVSANAAVIIDQTWDSGLQSWVNGGSTYGTLYNPSASLNVTGGVANVAIQRDYIHNAGAFTLGGSWTNVGQTVGAVWFDFYANANGTNDLPSKLQVYFLSDSTNYWYYDIGNLAAGWNSYYANVYASAGWYNVFNRSDALFALDLGDIDEVGIVLTYQDNLGGQEYGLDNFMLLDEPVPEPGTYAVLAFAFLSLGVTFRRQLAQKMCVVKSTWIS